MPLLEVRGLVKYYGRRRVVDGVEFEVHAGEVVGLLGPNGAGKTTSFRMTTGQITPYAGTVWFNGEDVTQLPMYKRARLGMGYLSQETSVFRKLSVEQNILAILEMMPMARTLGRSLTRRERWERTETVLEQFGLKKVRKNVAGRLSGGEKRRLEIARCLVCEPLLILLDEPFTGIDPKTIADIQEIVRDLRSQGIGLLLTDHNVREALKITNRSYLIKDGKVRTHGTPPEIIRDPIAIQEYLGKGFNDNSFAEPAPEPSTNSFKATAGADGACDESEIRPGWTRSRSSETHVAPARPRASEMPVSNESGSGLKTTLKQGLGEQEKMLPWIEALKTGDAAAAAAELVRRGPTLTPILLSALERRDVEIRQQVLEVLEKIHKRTLFFDPYAPEAMRKQQLAALRNQLGKKAG